MSKIDLKNAFRLVPVRPEDWNLLGICWQNQFYADTCLPYGPRSVPYLFNQLSIAIHWILQHSYGVQYLLHYLDDFFMPARQIHRCVQRICNQNLPCAGTSMHPLSYPRLRALPLHWYSLIFTSTMRRWKPASQMKGNVLYWTSCHGCEAETCVPSENCYISLIGKLSFCCKVVPAGRIFLCRMINLSNTVTQLHYRNSLTTEACLDIQWWLNFCLAG